MNSKGLTREDIERREEEILASYAALSSRSRGRVYPLKEHSLRTAFQRDRDRIIHSAAFRRMEYKTQVFIPHETDHYRTRLTHTIEVAQISRTMARNLRLNEDLAEAIALVHDLGHTPFGHSGEEVLNELLREHGGFNHNRQSLRVVDILEQRYDGYSGLNLTYEVREGIVKHETKLEIQLKEFNPEEKPTLEASLVDIADEITYNAHDIDDGLSSGIIDYGDLRNTAFFEKLQSDRIKNSLSSLNDKNRYALVRSLLDFMIKDVMAETQQRLSKHNITDLAMVRKAPEKICSYSIPVQRIVAELKGLLKIKLYNHPRLVSMSDWAQEIMKAIFFKIHKGPGLMPPRFQKMLQTEQKEIVIADYIAGMTDRYATKIYGELR